ncbi:ATP-binding protein [Enterovirga sp.]|uniref:sensor histidine kinase n=1 Tax=Enterovirga sp. TaxID=2026350 RepID=UPI0026034AC3|nr:ATP-binding protein [Enterovirga sp.]MDB5591372.1 two-component sensor histidine kinase [Enterovirga sp.]
MTARGSLLPKLVRTTAFRLSLAYLAFFAVSVFLILAYVAWNTTRLFNDQVLETIEAEITGLAEQYRTAGIRRLVAIVDRRSRQPGASLYLVTTFQGERIAGNVGSLPPGTLDTAGQREVDYARADEETREHTAIVKVFLLPGGFRLLVGRDLEDRVRIRDIMGRALGASLLLVGILGCLGGWFVSRRVLKRIDGMTGTTATIMAGDLSGRLEIAGTDDELDRLALNVNAMLDRIGELMAGITEVSNNIAHDLKTPLSRLRNRAEEALRTPDDAAALREALERVIDDSDNLIRIFNALLMIARLEAGHASESMEHFDAAQVTRDLAELYEPAAEDAGLSLEIEVEPDLPVHGSRELLGQAVANLIDNAIKYGAEGRGGAPGAVRVTAERDASAVRITVADRGPGIPEGDRARVLDRFVRLEAARTRPGFGLGLSLAAAVARLHGGALTLADHGPGLQAVLSLPVRTAAAAA